MICAGDRRAPRHGAAGAQAQIVALVNGDAITALDVAQRTKLIQLSTQKTPTRQEVLDELIEDRLKVQIAKRYISEVPKREIESAFANIARRAGMSADQFAKVVTASGVSVESLKARIHADFVWTQIIRGKFRAALQIGESEVAVKLQGAPNQKQEPTDFEYSLRPILFAGAARRGARPPWRRASAMPRTCARASRAATRDCALRWGCRTWRCARRSCASRPISASSSATSLNNTPVGRLTPPDVSLQGVELFAVCDKKEAKGGESVAKREAREAVYQERYQALSKKYLKELRSQALIEIR